MKKLSIMTLFLTFFCITLRAQESLKDEVEHLLEDSLFRSSTAAIEIFDLREKKVLFEKNSQLLLRPASNMKILTSAAGLYFLGPDYNFETSLYYTGSIKGSVLKGNIFIQGGGDPDFTTLDLDSLISTLKSLGIKKITGDITADITFTDSLFWGKGWMWDDDPSTDAPYLSALNINKNSVIVVAEPGERKGRRAKIKTIPSSSYFDIVNKSVTVLESDSCKLELQRDWINRSNKIFAQGNIGYNSNSITAEMNVYNPALYFLTLFKERIKENKIQFRGKLKFSRVPFSAKKLTSYKRPYSNVIMGLNKNSDNLSAEMTLRVLAERYYGRPAVADSGIKMIDSLITLAGLDYKSYRIVDGSGISHYNLVSAHLILSILKFIYETKPELFHILYNSFPVAGVDGTLKNRMAGSAAFSNVHAKTGTISGVSCLSGYVMARNNHPLAFSIMIQNYTGNSSKATRIQNELCRIMAEFE